jgi:hypothetical protein
MAGCTLLSMLLVMVLQLLMLMLMLVVLTVTVLPLVLLVVTVLLMLLEVVLLEVVLLVVTVLVTVLLLLLRLMLLMLMPYSPHPLLACASPSRWPPGGHSLLIHILSYYVLYCILLYTLSSNLKQRCVQNYMSTYSTRPRLTGPLFWSGCTAVTKSSS